jgi:iron complex transport system substrate-binding protein
MRPRTIISRLILASFLLLAACGDDDGDGSIPMTGNRPTTTAEESQPEEEAQGGGTFPTTVEAANGPVELSEQPESIVSLSPTATEMVFAIDAGDQVVAVDERSNFPEQAPVTDLSGFEPNVEAIASYDPDLVLVDGDAAITELEALDISVLMLPAAAALEDSYSQIEQLGQATGHVTEAEDLVTEMEADIEDLLGQAPETDQTISVYHELDGELYTAGSTSFIGQIYEMAGLDNIAAAIPGDNPYPQISAEEIVTANPQWIFLAYGGEDAVAAVRSRSAWDQITAVREDQVVSLDPDIASRWGPRTVVLLATILGTVAPPI